jgi:hypothetical protein
LNQTRIFFLVSTALLALILGACGGGDTGASAEVLTEAAIIYSQSLTETSAAASPTPEASPTEKPPTPTKTPEATVTPTLSGTPPTATPSPTNASANTACLRASFELETYPDGTQVPVEKLFTKLWRFKNIGSCPWTPNFSAVWVQGELFSAEATTLFTNVTIYPGEYAMIEVDMVAPKPPGHYKGYWMLRSDQGNLFGMGPNGTEWFWVDIETIPRQD